MQASTASMCFRKLSDWVYSVSKLHADSRLSMLYPYFRPVFSHFYRNLQEFSLISS